MTNRSWEAKFSAKSPAACEAAAFSGFSCLSGAWLVTLPPALLGQGWCHPGSRSVNPEKPRDAGGRPSVLPTSALTSVGGAGLRDGKGWCLRPQLHWCDADGRACAFESLIVSFWAGRYPRVGSWGVTGLPSQFAGWR